MVEKWCRKAVVRLATLPPEHPLYKPVKAIKGRYIKRHRSPLHLLFNNTPFDPKSIKKIPTKPRDPALTGKLPFNISIASSKEASIREDRLDNKTIKIYSDGSAHKGKVGAAATLIRPGQPPKSLHLHLGPDTEHTVHEVEIVGTVLALHLIKSEKNKNQSYSIGIDNQVAIKAYLMPIRKPAHYLAREVLQLGYKLLNRSRGRSRKIFLLMLRWTAGHMGIPGNELVDKEAKKAAESLSSDKKYLPTLLR